MRESYRDLLGKQVVVRNPRFNAEWRGKAIAYVEDPSFVIEDETGHRLVLPADWARKADT